MAFYEHTLIARPDLSGQQAQNLAEEFSELVKNLGGEVTKNEYWGLRSLAYRLKKNRKGHYLHLNISAPSSAIEELERNERIHEDVMRYLTIRVEELDANPSIFMQAKNWREDKGKKDRN